MNNKEHECIIGFLSTNEGGDVVTLSDLEEHIEDMKYTRQLFERLYKKTICNLPKVFTMAQYSDKRCSTDLRRFDYCPDCGKKIYWKQIKNGEI